MASRRRSSRPIEIVARVALHADRFRIIFAELLLGDVAVIALELLLGLQLRAIVRQLALAALAVLTGTIFAAIHRALRATPDVLAQTAVELVFGFCALRHSCRPFVSHWSCAREATGRARFPVPGKSQGAVEPRVSRDPGSRSRGKQRALLCRTRSPADRRLTLMLEGGGRHGCWPARFPGPDGRELQAPARAVKNKRAKTATPSAYGKSKGSPSS